MNFRDKKLQIPLKAELPLLFVILYLPSYLNQGTGFIRGFFDIPGVHIQMILLSTVYSLFIYYLWENIPSGRQDQVADCLGVPRFREFLLTLGGLALIYLVISAGLSALLPREGVFRNPEKPVLITKAPMLIPAAVTCLFSALQEEIFFRGYAYNRLLQSGISPSKAMFISTVLFSAGHLYQGVPGLLYAFAAGLFLVSRIQKGASLFSLIPAHALLNFIQILLNFFTEGMKI